MLTNVKPALPKTDQMFLIWRLVAYVVTGLMFGSLILSSYFIYTHIYQTLDLTNAVAVLNTNIGAGEIDFAAYQETEKKIAEKQAVLAPPDSMRNVFVYTSSTAASAASGPSSHAP